MKCKSCGEKVNFVLVEVVARWNDATKDWDRDTDTFEQPMCDKCRSFDVKKD